jgi:Lrp/AsnC family transcriptional regulator
MNLDGHERKILAILQEDCTLSAAEVAERVGLSTTPCWRRIQRLREAGVIAREVAIVDRRKVGLNAQIFAQVKLNAHGRQHIDEFTGAIRAFPEVLEAYVLMGPVDFLLRIVAEDIEAYERFFFDKLSRLQGVQEINSTAAMSEVKSTTALPLGVI